MYPTFNAEFARRDMTLAKLVQGLADRGITRTIPTMSLKLNGKSPITLKEAKAIKEILGTSIPIDDLFEERG